MGCDPDLKEVEDLRSVFQSTHPRGVRHAAGCGRVEHVRQVSIHAPAWGATAPGGRQLALCQVSIHAPAWGATWSTPACRPGAGCFNPRTRVGCDASPPWTAVWIRWFQSTHPRGVRHWRDNVWRIPAESFNPRTRVGCDLDTLYKLLPQHWFQSTHPRGVRPAVLILRRACWIWFQSTHPRGVRPLR